MSAFLSLSGGKTGHGAESPFRSQMTPLSGHSTTKFCCDAQGAARPSGFTQADGRKCCLCWPVVSANRKVGTSRRSSDLPHRGRRRTRRPRPWLERVNRQSCFREKADAVEAGASADRDPDSCDEYHPARQRFLRHLHLLSCLDPGLPPAHISPGAQPLFRRLYHVRLALRTVPPCD